jgi:hypothetical protein
MAVFFKFYALRLQRVGGLLYCVHEGMVILTKFLKLQCFTHDRIGRNIPLILNKTFSCILSSFF